MLCNSLMIVTIETVILSLSNEKVFISKGAIKKKVVKREK